MADSPSLMLKSSIGSNYDVDPDDVVVVKHFLGRLGHYKSPDWGLTDVPDSPMFKAITAFQKENGLAVDGAVKPGGKTAFLLGKQMVRKVASAPSESQCDHLYWNVDIPTCRALQAKRGKRAAAGCYHSATMRYAWCLQGDSYRSIASSGHVE